MTNPQTLRQEILECLSEDTHASIENVEALILREKKAAVEEAFEIIDSITGSARNPRDEEWREAIKDKVRSTMFPLPNDQ